MHAKNPFGLVVAESPIELAVVRELITKSLAGQRYDVLQGTKHAGWAVADSQVSDTQNADGWFTVLLYLEDAPTASSVPVRVEVGLSASLPGPECGSSTAVQMRIGGDSLGWLKAAMFRVPEVA